MENKRLSKKERLIDFKQNVLPRLKKLYTVVEHPYFFKIIIDHPTYEETFDYYPMGERISKKIVSKYPIYHWEDLTKDQFIDRFLP